MFSSPGAYLFAPGADGLKTLFTLGYQIRWGVDPTVFNGMHYPFGETINYATGHPVLAIVFSENGDAAENIVTIIQLMLLCGFIATPLIYYRLYRELGVPMVMAILAAFGLFMLNPQVLRLNSHIDLAHMWPIPLCLLLMLKTQQNQHWFHAPAYIVLTLGVFFIHPYLGLMLSGMWTSFFFAKWLLVREHRIQSAISAATGLVPLLVFVSLSQMIDDRTGRGIPGGFWEMVSKPTSILVPTSPPFGGHLSFMMGTHPPHWETLAYVGMTTIIVLTGSIIILVYMLLRGQLTPLKDFAKRNRFALLLFISSIPILWFSMGMFLTGESRYTFIDKFKMIAQFRAPGRLAWVFWHSATLLTVVTLSEWVKKSERSFSPKRRLYFALACALLLLYGVEGITNTLKAGVTKMDASKNVLDSCYFPEEEEVISFIEAQNFEAQVTLPYFHIGSENFGPDTDPDLKAFAFRISLQTGLPLCSSQMSRTSYTETWQQVTLWYEAFIKPSILSQFRKDGKLLILAKPYLCVPAERQIISMADSLMTYGDIVLYSIENEKLEERHEINLASHRALMSAASSAEALNTFDNHPGGKVCGIRGDWEVLTDLYTGSLDPLSPWVVSFWVRGANRERVIRQIFKIGINTENGWRQQFSGALCHNITGVTEEDALVEFFFTPDMPNDSVRIEIFNEELPNHSMKFDNALVREQGSNVKFVDDGNTYLNNRPCFPQN